MIREIVLVVMGVGALASAQKSCPPAPATIHSDETVFYYGNIGNFQVSMQLQQVDDGVTGSYRYATQLRELVLTGKPTPEGGWKIIESSGRAKIVTGEFSFAHSPGLIHLNGTWRSADGRRSYPVQLARIFEEQYRELGDLWKAKRRSGTAELSRQAPTPVLRSLKATVELPLSEHSSGDPSTPLLAGRNSASLFATFDEIDDLGTTVRIWKPQADKFLLIYEHKSMDGGPSVATFSAEAFSFSHERFIHLIHLFSGTGYLHDDIFLWVAPDLTLQEVKFTSPAKGYRELREGEGIWKGEVNAFRENDASFRFNIWKSGDANGAPTGGQITGSYKLIGGKQYNLENEQWEQDFQIVPANYTRIATDTE